jgi:hypothetical protein
MESTIIEILNKFTNKYSLLQDENRENLWLINLNTNEWAFNYYVNTQYLWFNYDLFSNFFKYLSLTIPENNIIIKKWVESRCGVVVGNNYHPDYLPNHYDFRKDFDIKRITRKLSELNVIN